MSMISDLVERLRVESKSMGKYGTDYMATLLTQAADTIVRLSEKARADRPQGEWIEVDDVLISCRCSVCGWEAHLYEDDVYGMPYCPNCGSRMKGADDE